MGVTKLCYKRGEIEKMERGREGDRKRKKGQRREREGRTGEK